MKKTTLIMLLLLCTKLISKAQVYNDTSQYEIRLENGETLVGTILKSTTNEITLKSLNFGPIDIPRSNISRIRESYDGAKFTKDEHFFYRSRYFLTESALMPQQGQIFIENKAYFMFGAGVGITKNISVDAHTLLIPEYGEFLSNVGIKVGHSFTKNVHLAARYNVLQGDIYEELYRNYLSGYLTLGQPNRNITFGYTKLGYHDYFFDPISNNSTYLKTNSPVITFGASLDINKKYNFKFEHAYMTKEGTLTTIGMAYNGKVMILNYGVTLLQYTKYIEEEIFPVPYVSFSFSLGDGW